MVGAAGIPIYPKGGRLCLSACPGDGKVKKLPSIPLRIISVTALTVSLWNGDAPLIHERQIVDDITPALAQLHWLSLRQWVHGASYKVANNKTNQSHHLSQWPVDVLYLVIVYLLLEYLTHSSILYCFYRATRMHSADDAMARCLSVCPSHAGIECKRLYPQKFFSPSVSPTILVFPHQTWWQYSYCNTLNGGVECEER